MADLVVYHLQIRRTRRIGLVRLGSGKGGKRGRRRLKSRQRGRRPKGNERRKPKPKDAGKPKLPPKKSARRKPKNDGSGKPKKPRKAEDDSRRRRTRRKRKRSRPATTSSMEVGHTLSLHSTFSPGHSLPGGIDLMGRLMSFLPLVAILNERLEVVLPPPPGTPLHIHIPFLTGRLRHRLLPVPAHTRPPIHTHEGQLPGLLPPIPAAQRRHPAHILRPLRMQDQVPQRPIQHRNPPHLGLVRVTVATRLDRAQLQAQALHQKTRNTSTLAQRHRAIVLGNDIARTKRLH